MASKNGRLFDVAHCAADLDQHEIVVVVALKPELLDGVGDDAGITCTVAPR